MQDSKGIMVGGRPTPNEISTRAVQPAYTMASPMTGISALAGCVRREISPVEITKECLRRIGKLNHVLNAFIKVTQESALVESHTAENEILRGPWRGALHAPIALIDVIDTAGVPTPAASALCRDRIPDQDAGVVRRLREAGVVILGKNKPL